MLTKTINLCKKIDLALCVCTSHAYKDIWDLFYFYWNKHFFSNEIPVYFLSSEKYKANDKMYSVVYPFNSKSTDPWSNRISECLEQIKHKNIITTTEDAILNKNININKFYDALNFFNQNNLDFLKICPFYPNRSKEIQDNYVSHDSWELHRVNITNALWKKKSLEKLLIKNESINEFDMFASSRADNEKFKVYHCDFKVLNYVEIIHGGKFNFQAKKYLKETDYINKNSREFNSFYENIIILINYFKLYVYSILPIFFKKILIQKKIIGYKK
tara:strand:- start:105 stop:923 length:819 start_codon:yes stop_codon:yes gene_type:complete